jgi:BirA family biotin operon repressor/biotin-[acetyl-CoA-carboxylase] ligase
MFVLERIEEVDSTSSELMRRLDAGALPGVALLARRQTAARGRLGRRWAAIEGNLFLSVSVGVDGLRFAGHWALLAGVALVAALDLPCARLKWPNDVLVDGRKLAGILVEAQTGPRGAVLVIGVGVNVVAAPDGLGRPVVCLTELGVATDAEDVAAAFLAQFAAWVTRYRLEGFGPVKDAWLNGGPIMGEPLSVQHGPDRVEGTFAGLGQDGELLLDIAGRMVAVSAGEVLA